MPEQFPPKKIRRDRTHDPKPNSGWWGETERHRQAAQKNNSRGGLGSVAGASHKVVPTRRVGGHVVSALGRRSK